MSAIKKISLQEKRKLERRLPLWESSYWVTKGDDKLSLFKKINDARNLLGMDEFLKPKVREIVKREKKKSGPKPKGITKAKATRMRSESMGIPGLIERRYVQKHEIKGVAERIAYMHNELGMSDSEIARELGKAKSFIFKIRSENIDIVYKVKYKDEIDLSKRILKGKIIPSEYIELKTKENMIDGDISKMYGINEVTLTAFKKKYIKVEYKLKKNK